MLRCIKVALWHLKSWKGSARIIIVFLLAVIMTVYQSMEYLGYAKEVDMIVNCLETYILVTNNEVYSVVMFILVLVLFADAPFMDNNSLYVVSRIGRYRWCIGKMLYIIIAAIVFNLVCMLTTVIVSIPYSYPGDIWSSAFIASTNGETVELGYQAIFNNSEVIYFFSPLRISMISMGLKTLLNCMMGMVLFVLNMGNKKVLGYGIVSILYFAEYTVSGTEIAKITFIKNSILGMQKCFDDIKWSLMYFSGIIVAMIIISLIVIRKVDYKITIGERL